jgi:hypothetical protein
MRYAYSFTDREGRTHQAVFHSDGGPYVTGNKVKVEYLRADPGISWIVGLEPQLSGVALGIFIVFIAPGVWMMTNAVKYSMKDLNLLRYGEASVGNLTSKALHKSGDTDSTGRASFKYYLTYAFTANDGNTYELFRTISAGILLEKSPESDVKIDPPTHAYVLYDPPDPNTAALASMRIPGHPKFDRPGAVYSSKPQKLIAYLILPALVVGGHMLWSYLS